MAALTPKTDRSFSSLVPGTAGQLRFCTSCGEPASRPPHGASAQPSRICRGCGMGVMLSCHTDALPGAGAAFVITDVELRLTAVSAAGQELLGPERDLLDKPLLGLFGSPLGDARLTRTLSRAAIRAQEPEVLPVRGLFEGGSGRGMMAARISTCGPPRGALMTVEPSAFGVG